MGDTSRGPKAISASCYKVEGSVEVEEWKWVNGLNEGGNVDCFKDEVDE